MKKILTLFLFVFLILISAREARGDYATDYQSYINVAGDYQTAHDTYLTARAAYLASQSLDSQDKAKAATLKMLESRDNLTNAYLKALISKIQAVKGMTDSDKSSLVGQINTEISWYTVHNNKLSSAGSLNDLVTDSNEAKSEFNTLTKTVIYKSLIYLGSANNSYIREEINGEITTLEA